MPADFRIEFDHASAPRSLHGGETYAVPRESGFRDTPAADLLSLVAEIDQGRPWREAVDARYAANHPWLHSIIVDPRRTGFFSLLPATKGPVLDIGAGWGQIARPLARERPVVALEPVAERMAFIRAAAKQDGVAGNLAFVEADYLETAFRTPFAAICAIGVLEWVGANQDKADPQERQHTFLRKVRAELAADGTLVLGIENRVGLKYLLGCPDDHIGAANIACLPAGLARQRWQETTGRTLQSFTYSLGELTQLLHAAGFSRCEFFGAFPDYKLPSKIVSLANNGRDLGAWLQAGPIPREHDGYHGNAVDPLFQQTLEAHYRTFAAEGIARNFVPSFFVVARP